MECNSGKVTAPLQKPNRMFEQKNRLKKKKIGVKESFEKMGY